MTRSNDTLTKSIVTTPDYKKMTSKGSIDSMDKSVISTDTSLGGYDSQTISQKPSGVGYTHKNKFDSIESSPVKRSPQYAPKLPQSPHFDPEPYAFELAYRNEGFRDNSTLPTRNNSIGTTLNDDSPIVHHTDFDDSGSEYYGKSSTLPIRTQDNLSFLTELKQHLPPEYEQLNSGHSSFMPSTSSSNPGDEQSPGSSSSRRTARSSPEQKSSLPSKERDSSQTEKRKVNDYAQPLRLTSTHDPRRPDSYYTAMRDARDSRSAAQLLHSPVASGRPKTLYQSAGTYDRPVNLRSKSEALLESNFDEIPEDTVLGKQPQLTSDSRSYSQPMETAM